MMLNLSPKIAFSQSRPAANRVRFRRGEIRLDSGTLPPPTRRMDGYGRASEATEAQAHGR